MIRPRVAIAALLAAAPVSILPAQQPAGAPPAAAQQRIRPFADVTKDAIHRPGFIDTYQKDDKVWLAIPQSRFDNDFLMEMKLAQGVGAAGLYGGTMLNLFEANLMVLERRGDQV